MFRKETESDSLQATNAPLEVKLLAAPRQTRKNLSLSPCSSIRWDGTPYKYSVKVKEPEGTGWI